MTKQRTKLHQDRPDCTSALRELIWRHQVDSRPFTAKEIESTIQAQRPGMGLAVHQGGAVSTYRQQRTRGLKLHRESREPVHYVRHGAGFRPAPEVERDWRFVHAPAHPEVRVTAAQGRLIPVDRPDDLLEAIFYTRAPWLPTLRVLFGPVAQVTQQIRQHHRQRRGLYLLLRNGRNYVGQTGEFGTRGRSHERRGAERALFAFLDDEGPSRDALDIAESLAITALSELLEMETEGRGRDCLRDSDLAAGSILATAFLAAVIRWAHDCPDAAREFLVWRPKMVGLANGYLNLTLEDHG